MVSVLDIQLAGKSPISIKKSLEAIYHGFVPGYCIVFGTVAAGYYQFTSTLFVYGAQVAFKL
jgi:hypothetical protein